MANARHKLNVAYFNGALLFSAILGLGSQSWAVFLIVFAAAISLNLYLGEIRPGPGR